MSLIDIYGTDNGPECACGNGTVYSYDLHDEGVIRRVIATCVACSGREELILEVDPRDPERVPTVREVSAAHRLRAGLRCAESRRCGPVCGAVACPTCGKRYARCARHDGEAGARRSLHSHQGLAHSD